ncbi:MAG TPA: hypothetical protein VFR37_12330 [Longimicrobium sp.]|nr:hypothetical protein [Longimicrobium sp.]
MQTRTATEARLDAAELDPAIRASLPPVVVGEAPAAVVDPSEERPWDNDWPGGVFVFLCYAVAAGLGIGACVSAGAAALGLGRPPLEMLGQAAVMGAGAAFQWRLAGAVEHSSRWGWYGAMAELTAAAAAKVWLIADGNVVGGVIGLVIDLLWMRFFWNYREQFDVDVDL